MVKKSLDKDRPDYEPQIYPTSYLIQPVSTSSTFTYVDNVRPLFNYNSESNDRDFQNKIKIISQNTLVTVVSGLGTVSISINNTGVGYTVTPTLSLQRMEQEHRNTYSYK